MSELQSSQRLSRAMTASVSAPTLEATRVMGRARGSVTRHSPASPWTCHRPSRCSIDATSSAWSPRAHAAACRSEMSTMTDLSPVNAALPTSAATSPAIGSAIASATNRGGAPAITSPPATAASSPNATRFESVCDQVVASPCARFRLPELSMGLIPGRRRPGEHPPPHRSPKDAELAGDEPRAQRRGRPRWGPGRRVDRRLKISAVRKPEGAGSSRTRRAPILSSHTGRAQSGTRR